MNIQHDTDAKGGRFFYTENEKELATMTYVWAGKEKMIIDHTEVDPVLKGKGVGNQLVAAAVEKARAEGFKILPLCPFAKAVISKNESYQDVLAG